MTRCPLALDPRALLQGRSFMAKVRTALLSRFCADLIRLRGVFGTLPISLLLWTSALGQMPPRTEDVFADPMRYEDVEHSAVSNVGIPSDSTPGNIDNTWKSGYQRVADRIGFLSTYFTFSYFFILGLLSFYGVRNYRLIYLFLRYRHFVPRPKMAFAQSRLPRVTVQLWVFNEMYVAERLIDAVAALDYPRECLEIQVLDDSTDMTQIIASMAVDKYYRQGYEITYVHRKSREGFKAGALEAGLKKASGEFILILDADCVPRRDCIRRMIHSFTDERVGSVQVRWSHINADYSLLTKAQSIMLQAHFVVGQTARNRGGDFLDIQGTTSMWRRNAIEWSGGWQHDTLAEDTDLSYRAQLMDWRFVYLVDDDVPSELPVEISGFKSQQRRWGKGRIQVGLKMIGRVLRDPRLAFKVKFEQFIRLSGTLAAPLATVFSILNLPIAIARSYDLGLFLFFIQALPIVVYSILSIGLFYVVAQWHLYPKTWRESLKYIPFAMTVRIVLAFSNARTVIGTLFGVAVPFVRTPKYATDATRRIITAAAQDMGTRHVLDKPPRHVAFILSLVLSNKHREPFLGDLDEDYRRLRDKSGSRVAKFWYYRQALKSLAPLVGRRIRRAVSLAGISFWLRRLIGR
jgi:cellulose synthase/poly-beta-1,6-N-acetylglucosamine synthase-like glycosyltransferase